MNFEPNNVSSCVLAMPSVYVAMKSADDQRLSSLPNSCYQKDNLARHDGNSSSFIERKSERVDHASGHDDDGDEAVVMILKISWSVPVAVVRALSTSAYAVPGS